MKKSAKCELITVSVSAILTIVLGLLLHFLYEICDKNSFVALFSPINESVWEHLKLIFTPFVFTMSVEYFIYGKNKARFFFSKLVGVTAGLLTTLTLFYTYTGIWGMTFEVINIILYVISIICAYGIALILMNTLKKRCDILESLSIFALALICVAFFIFTFYPPEIPLFGDPTNMTYGI